METDITPTALATAAGISVPYASQIISGTKVPPLAMAVRIYTATSKRFGPIVDATDSEIATLARFQPDSLPPVQSEAA